MNLFERCCENKLNENLEWLNEPPKWNFDSNNKLTIVPQAVSDFFRPYGQKPNDNACLLYTKVSGDFTAITKVRVELVDFGDAAAITIRANESLWAKLCVERSPTGDISLVSVVTNNFSDDANSELVDTSECLLRITRKGNVFAMHYSLDGSTWRFVRMFSLETPSTLMVGVHAQAPFTGGCKAEFDFFNLTSTAVKDFRSGE